MEYKDAVVDFQPLSYSMLGHFKPALPDYSQELALPAEKQSSRSFAVSGDVRGGKSSEVFTVSSVVECLTTS